MQGTTVDISVSNPPPPPAHDSNNPISLSAPPRRGSKRKKPMTWKQRAALEQKLRLLKNLQPISFRPNKTLDLSKHEKLFRTLGLWDFAHLDLDQDIRSDLLTLLIANYDPNGRCSYVKDQRVQVNRSDLGRALKLPVKKEKLPSSDFLDSDQDGFSQESIAVVDDFMSNYILLHEDTWMMPKEVVLSEKLIKEGQLHKIDWAGLIWLMVEKELSQPTEAGYCYYASHLQFLMKSQKPDIFKDDDEEEVLAGEDEDNAAVTLMTESMDVFQEHDLENERVELTLGQEKIEREADGEDEIMEFQECKEEEEEQGQWLLDDRNAIGGLHSLRHCSLNVLGTSACEPEIKGEEEAAEEEEDDEEEEEGGGRYSPSEKFPKLDRLVSTDLLQDMETVTASYLPVNVLDPPSGELLMQRSDTHKNIPPNHGGLSMFGNDCKREISDGEAVHHVSHNDHHRKMRNDGPWDHTLGNFGMCMEQVRSWLNKAQAMHEEKEEVYTRANFNVQILTNEIRQRDNFIHSLENKIMEEQHKKQLEIYRLERELCVMTQLLHGYKKALKETRTAFSEYRERSQLPDEPVYKDAGGNGCVLSVMELERLRLEKEEEEKKVRFAFEEKVKGIEQVWLDRFGAYVDEVDLLDKRLLKIIDEIRLLKGNGKKQDLTP